VDNNQNASTKSDQQRFLEHLEKATAIVRTWPQWKQSLLGFPKAITEASPSEGAHKECAKGDHSVSRDPLD
jgi:hypothetical protein